jgi:lactoylglutathione lyase
LHIEHVAIWTRNLESLRAFYETYFGGTSGPKYTNPVRQFESYFVSFEGGARLELMHMPSVPLNRNSSADHATGLIHLALSVGSSASVDALTGRLRAGGFAVVSEPRRTGDGYYESCVLDPDGNRVEITA